MATVKRILVDPDTKQEVSSAKKPRYELQDDIKDKVLKFLALAYYDVYLAFFHNDYSRINCINVSVQVMNIAYTAYNILRQENQGITSGMAAKAAAGTPKITSLGINRPVEINHIKGRVSRCASHFGLVFSRTPTPGKIEGPRWFGICGPYFNFLMGFGMRWKELRLGHAEFPYMKTATQTKSYPVNRYGLNKAHHILLEGIRFPPEKRSSMIQSLGPMTALLCYLENPPNYANKFETATINALAHIPNIEGILKTIKGQNKASIRTIIEHLADISIMTTTRQRQRFFPPPCIFAFLCVDPKGLRGLQEIEKLEAPLPFGLPEVTNISNEVIRQNLTFSGIGAAYLYNLAAEYHLWILDGEFTEAQAQQAIFHCCWGTYKEDLGVLAQITDNALWQKRDQMAGAFQKQNNSLNSLEIKLISLKYFAKLSSANQTGLLSQGTRQVASVPVFGGRRTRMLGEEFFKYLEENAPTGSGGLTLQGIESDLSTILRMLKQNLKATGGRQDDVGTCNWVHVGGAITVGMVDGTDERQAVPMTVRETCEYFLG